jgi:putative SbcD/Mre11-related phosphoesterase
MVKLQPLQGIPALLLGMKEKTICIADLHLGYELELRQNGFNIPDQTPRIAKSIVDIEEGDRLLILGDVKHTIPYTTVFESVRLSRFFKLLSERYASVTIVMGNHDGGIRKSIPDEVEVVSSGGLVISSIGLSHGHSWPSREVMKSRILVSGHIHPSLSLRDRLGSRNSIKCWLRGAVHKKPLKKRYSEVNVSETIIMPAYNPLLTGSAVNEGNHCGLSPLLRSKAIVLGEQKAYTLDGTYLGHVSQLMTQLKE